MEENNIQNLIIDYLKKIGYEPKLNKENNTIYFENFVLIFDNQIVHLHFNVDTYPDLAATIGVALSIILKSVNAELKIGEMFSPIYNSFGLAIDLAFGEEAKKEYEQTTKRYYLNQKHISEFLEKVDIKQLHHC